MRAAMLAATVVIASLVLLAVTGAARADAADLRARLEAGDCDGCDLIDVDLRGIILRGQSLRLGAVRNVDWSQADLSDAVIIGDLAGNFAGAKLDRVTIRGKLSGSFRGASLVGAELRQGISGKIDGADLSNAKIYGLRRNAGEWIRDSRLDGAQLSFDFCYQAPIERSSLRGANLVARGTFRHCNLLESDLSEAQLDGWLYSEMIVDSRLDRAHIRLRRSNASVPSQLQVVRGSLRDATIDGDVANVRLDGVDAAGLLINGRPPTDI